MFAVFFLFLVLVTPQNGGFLSSDRGGKYSETQKPQPKTLEVPKTTKIHLSHAKKNLWVYEDVSLNGGTPETPQNDHF